MIGGVFEPEDDKANRDACCSEFLDTIHVSSDRLGHQDGADPMDETVP
jgi:hypothetical protein